MAILEKDQIEFIMKPGKTGIPRIIDAAGYSIQGLKAAWKHEAAFRQEVALALILVPLAFFVGNTAVEIILLVSSIILVVICELANSALEAAIDRFGGEIHELSRIAKDIGSAMVMVALALCAFTWLMISYQNFWS